MGVVIMIRHGCDNHEYGNHKCDRMRLFRIIITFMLDQGASSH